MTRGGPRALLYVTADPDGTPRLVAALERGVDGELWFAPDSERISTPDLRGRRTTLGALLAAHDAGGRDDLIDVAAHLVPLPELGAEPASAEPDPSSPRVELRTIGLAAAGAAAYSEADLWPAPGGGSFAVRSAPLRTPPRTGAALLASRSAPGGPWLRTCSPVTTEVQNLVTLLCEVGVPLADGDDYVERWLGGLLGEREDVDDAHLQRLLEGGRALVRETLVRGSAPPLDVEGTRLTVRAEPAPEHVRWTFDLEREGLEGHAEVEAARCSPEAVADLLAVVDAPHQPYWLLLFEERPPLGTLFVGVVDVRRYLSENVDRLEDAP